MLTCMWWGYGGGSWMAERLRCLIENELGMKLVTIHEHPDANIKWDLNNVFDHLKKADIIILPANYKRQPCKSNNRLTQAMALKKPIICEPMPSYKRIVKHGVNAFITLDDSIQEWERFLRELRDNETLRKTMAEEAYKTAQSYSLENTTKQWLKALSSITKNEQAVDVVIPTKNNYSILKECIKSFENSTEEEYIYIIDNGDDNSPLKIAQELNLPYEERFL